MSKLRLIPKLQLTQSVRNPNRLVLVITRQFGNYIEIGDPVSQAKIFQDQAADELIFVNISSYRNKQISMLSSIINNISQEIFMPLTVGGGVASIEDFRALLSNGADKISINSSAYKNPNLITEAAERFGSQCVVVSMDYQINVNGQYSVFIDGGNIDTGVHPVEWALRVVELGAGEILLTSIDKDGSKNGLDIELTNQVATNVTVPVITSGGCGLAMHFSEGLLLGKANAVSAGTFFAHRDQNLMQTRSQIKNSGVNIRFIT